MDFVITPLLIALRPLHPATPRIGATSGGQGVNQKALSADDCERVLKDLEEPYVARLDPYAESKPIHDPTWFYGGDKLLKRLPAVLAQGQHVGIFGLRKVGKTSLINQLRQRFVATSTVFID